MRCALCAIVLVAFGLVGCEDGLDIYSIDAPSDLQARIDSIEAAKNAVDTGDTTYLTISTAIVGAEDNSSGWNSAISDYFTIPIDQKLVLKFENYGSGVNNWNNWNLALGSMADREADDYSEYFVLRSDAYGWGNGDFDLGVVSQNYPDLDGDEDIWNDFRQIMQGADVTLEVDFSATGYVFVTATAVGTEGTELVMTYNQPVVGAQEVSAFLIVDNSHFLMKEAYLLPSQVTEIVDAYPVSLDISGTPVAVEIGNENFWGNAVATVSFDDGSTAEVDSADLSFNVVPDMTTLGEKTITVAYSKTKQGEYGPAVSTFYTLSVNNPVSSMEVTGMPDITTYYFFNSDSIIFDNSGLEVTATYADASTGILDLSTIQYDSIAPVAGSQDLKISYKGATSTVTTTIPLTLVKGIAQVGYTDMTTPWWTEFSDEFNIPSGESKTVKMYCYSNEINVYHSPVVILRKADLTEYAGLRMDNFGWGDSYPSATLTNDWNFDVFAENINGSYIEITVTNNGDGTANVRYDVTYATGETHFQEYAGVTVDSADLNFTLVLEGAYLIIVE